MATTPTDKKNEGIQGAEPVSPAETSIRNARTEAANDIDKDPDTHPEPSEDDLDEGELARRDNSND